MADVTDETVTAALLADVEWARAGRELVWQTLSTERARNLLEAAAPLIAAAERERAEVAEARLSAVATYCQERAHFAPIAKSILAITGDGQERSDEGDDGGH